MSDLVYKGVPIPGVPEGAFVVETRGFGRSTGVGSSGAFVLDDPWGGVSEHLLRGTDLAGLPLRSESGQRLNGRIIGFGSALRVYSVANVWWYQEIRVSLQRCDLDTSGTLVTGSESHLLDKLYPHPLAAASVFRVLQAPIVDGPCEALPIRAPFAELLRFDETHGLRGTWEDAGPTVKAIGVHRIEVAVAVAVWLEPENGPASGLVFPEVGSP